MSEPSKRQKRESELILDLAPAADGTTLSPAKYFSTWLDFLLLRPSAFFQTHQETAGRYLGPVEFMIGTLLLFGILTGLHPSLPAHIKPVHLKLVTWQAGLLAFILAPATLYECLVFRSFPVRKRVDFRKLLAGKFYWSAVWIFIAAVHILVPVFFGVTWGETTSQINAFVRLFTLALLVPALLLAGWYYVATLLVVHTASLSQMIKGFLMYEGLPALILGLLIYWYAPVPREAVIVISQVYGGGGNQGAPLKSDFVELFNRSEVPVDLTNWSLQYAPAGSGKWEVMMLSGVILPGHYYLVQCAIGGGGADVPTPDATASVELNAKEGKVALVSDTGALKGVCPASASIVDLVGYGGGANCFEGSGSAPALSNTNAALRGAKGCQDTNDNAQDFTSSAPSARNSTYLANIGAGS